ncbi:hypothetical protein [Acholeplasma equifetale]|uniref:hypothetical protein n=1 Tax=Acholeplasma equifetale TaxID=264634 RepID=UPI000479478D|nr:hypothetical protein [Acholeplasma equifetale]
MAVFLVSYEVGFNNPYLKSDIEVIVKRSAYAFCKYLDNALLIYYPGNIERLIDELNRLGLSPNDKLLIIQVDNKFYAHLDEAEKKSIESIFSYMNKSF